jgi:hypothetical protein
MQWTGWKPRTLVPMTTLFFWLMSHDVFAEGKPRLPKPIDEGPPAAPEPLVVLMIIGGLVLVGCYIVYRLRKRRAQLST